MIMVHSFFDPRKKAAMMDRVKKGLPPPEFGVNPFAAEKNKIETTAPLVEDPVEKAKQAAIQQSIHDARTAIFDAKNKCYSRWKKIGAFSACLASAAAANAVAIPLLHAYVPQFVNSANPIMSHFLVGSAIAVAGIFLFVAVDALSKEELLDYIKAKFANHGVKKYDTILKVLDILEHNPIPAISDKDLTQIAKDAKQVEQLRTIAATGSGVAERLVNRIDNLSSHANESYPIEW